MNELKLPNPDTHCLDDEGGRPIDVWSYSPELVRQIIEADRAQQAARHSEELAQQAQKTDVHALFWAMRSKILKLPRYSFLLNNGGGVSKVADRYGRWIEKDSAAELCEVEHVDALLEAADEIETHERKPMTPQQILDLIPDDNTENDIGEWIVLVVRGVEKFHDIKETT
jgi:hypothetical protein